MTPKKNELSLAYYIAQLGPGKFVLSGSFMIEMPSKFKDQCPPVQQSSQSHCCTMRVTELAHACHGTGSI